MLPIVTCVTAAAGLTGLSEAAGVQRYLALEKPDVP